MRGKANFYAYIIYMICIDFLPAIVLTGQCHFLPCRECTTYRQARIANTTAYTTIGPWTNETIHKPKPYQVSRNPGWVPRIYTSYDSSKHSIAIKSIIHRIF